MTSSSSVGWNLKPGARAVGVVVFVGVSELWVSWSSLERCVEEKYQVRFLRIGVERNRGW